MPYQYQKRPLIRSRRFLPLFVTQFFAAFSDNFLKNSLVFLILAYIAAGTNGYAPEGGSHALITLAGAVFIAPFLLFSAVAGEIADRFDKALVARVLKFAELGFAALAVTGMALGSIPLLMVTLFLFGTGSAFFGPVKYSILPDHLRKSELPAANAWMQGGTFTAILGGTLLAGVLFAVGRADAPVFGSLIVAFSLIAWIASCLIPRTGRAQPDLSVDWNIARSTGRLLRELGAERRLLVTALMVSWCWFTGAIVLSLLAPLVQGPMGGTPLVVALFLAAFTVAVACGSAVAAWLSAGRIVLLQATIGTLIIGGACVDMGLAAGALGAVSAAAAGPVEFFARAGSVHIGVDLVLAGIGGGFLVVPSFAALQAWAHPERRARVVAANNVLNAGFMTLGGFGVAGLQALGVSFGALLAGLGILSLVAAVLMVRFLPTSLFRDFTSILLRAFYGLEVTGMENLEKAGPAPILAFNHVSFLDALLANVVCDTGRIREPVLAINADVANRWWLKPFLRGLTVFPLDPTHPMATRTLIHLVQEGRPLVIFPEGRITVTGSLMKVYDGAAMIAEKTGSMIVPVKIEGLERSFFSRLTAMQTRKQWFPKVRVKVTAPVRLNIDPALKGSARWQAASGALYRLMSDLMFSTSFRTGTVFEEVVRTGHLYGMGRLACEDPNVGAMTYGRLLTAVRVLGSKLHKRFRGENTLGFLLPNACGSFVTFLAIISTGRTPAMLNFTAGVANLVSACEVSQTRTVLTSRAFIEQARLEALVEGLEAAGLNVVYLDDIRTTVSAWDKIRGLLMRNRRVGPRRVSGDAVAILFTSGSEGKPKGVVLTHANMMANVAQAAARIDFHNGDKVFNVLPMFHAFGLTLGTVLPVVSGVPVYLYPSPLHYHLIPEAVYASSATILFGTDTFVAGYGRSAHPYDFHSVRYCIVGAEPVKRSTRELFMNKFGIRILEGYGVTECAPVLALNTPMYNRPGTVGKLLPGVEWRLEPVEDVEEGGRLVVRGSSVMAGYLLADEPGVLKPPPDGWHDTGDIVTVDDEGYVTIVGRARRFAKIGGEMVSLAAVETLIDELWPGVPRGVVAVADPRKGERLVLVTEYEEANRGDLLKFARQKGVSELSVPSRIIVGSVPVLGSGKTDYTSLKAYAEQSLKQEELLKMARETKISAVSTSGDARDLQGKAANS
ncbi:acyl-[ACP]--phospholipid O-acyltransferase [Phaeovibrio sulfidiphilus]|uniref:Acyl-[ACP]--phospholipid O-acyltransferase n=1 Tax=Phaeovibrio sulfidiphilus TaxID=1220600 RepID=A0A8J6YLV1_9PROT|nr:acyl-[ACP]--phospholipid O-acyltransferase [Phaeovibrio sulfidiphilus]MBE1236174.1 acyl-[ACP]--phospholipid O-acyltransferase [Phaeovibrio sulfidiphilus]